MIQLRHYEPGRFSRRDLLERVCTGGYPEIDRLAARERPGLFRDYVLTTIERDVVQLAGIRKVAEIGQLLRLFAARTSCELVMQGIIDDAPLERQAVHDHRAWLETIQLITMLLRRQLTWAAADVTMYHWQDRSGAEVDIVLEAADGRVAAFYVKTHQTAKPEWFRWLGVMRDTVKDKFMTGIALYAGNDVLPFGDRLIAAPISSLREL
jgi:uncharacterized protein